MKPDSSQSQQKVREKLEPKKKGLKSEKKAPAAKKGAKKAKEARSAAALAGSGPGGSSERPPSLLLPLRQFVDNPCQMIEQLFQAVGREELAAMQPTILQGLPQEEVKQLCLKQLESMTKQEILDILSGCEVKEQKYAVDPTATANVVTSTDATVASDVTKGLEANKAGERLSSVAEASEALELFPAREDMEMLAMDEPPAVISEMSRPPPTVPATPGEGDLATNLTKMQMEILELQLRRRAIKALLRSQKGPGGEDDDDDDDEEEIVMKEEKG